MAPVPDPRDFLGASGSTTSVPENPSPREVVTWRTELRNCRSFNLLLTAEAYPRILVIPYTFACVVGNVLGFLLDLLPSRL